MGRLLLVFLVVLLVVAAAGLLWTMVTIVRRSTARPVKPGPEAGDGQWAAYYRSLEDHARRTGDEDSAGMYASLAGTYEELARHADS